ncbi:MAG: DegT/DnrJ/EryC1/StrS family aminotransferase [Pseudonocardiaceae bacterium]
MTLARTAPADSTRLAIDGGTPVCPDALPTWPRFDRQDATTAADVLLSGRVNYWTGEHGRAFEREFAQWAGAPHAVAVANGTVALEIALRALGVGAGDEVIVPSATFIATASAVVACGARPVVVDVDRDSQALTVATVAPAITSRTAAVIVVHVGGYPADTAALADLAAAQGLHLVEDCAQAHGAYRDGRHVGTRGRIAAWSFCQDKIMTTAGEGGAVTTGDAWLARRCWELKDHGKSYPAVYEQEHPPGFRWLHDSFGTNARMTEIQAAVGRLQLPKLPGWVAVRRAHGEALRAAVGDLPALRLPVLAPGVEHAYYRFYGHVRTERLKTGWDRDRIVAAVTAEGVPCGSGGCTEIYRERAFDAIGRPATPLPVAQWLGRHSLVLPVHPALSTTDVRQVAAAVRKVFAEATA